MASGGDTLELDPQVLAAVGLFLQRLASGNLINDVILFGSRARSANRPDSDVDLAVVYRERLPDRYEIVDEMAGIAFDVLLETGVLIEALPLWADEFERPETMNNPTLIANILREGIRL